jgi:ribosomal protein S18 acetylase RimI-like enzyme
MKITFTPVSDANIEVAVMAYGSTREHELAVVAWTAEQKAAFIRMQFNAQQLDYQARFPEAVHSIIEVDGQAAGRLYLARLADSLRILDITILPPQRNAGIGQQIISELMEEAKATGKAVRIFVENFNPSLRLFERLGFVPVEERGVHLLMEWKGPDAAARSDL